MNEGRNEELRDTTREPVQARSTKRVLEGATVGP